MSARRKVAAAVGVAAVAGAAVALSQYVPPNERGQAITAGDLSGSLVGAGASSQQAAMQGWTAGYSGVQPGVTVDYDPVGSGGGREQFTTGGIDFAGSDAPLDEEELVAARERCGGEVFELPNYISPIAVVHNVPGVPDLALSPATLAGVFARQIPTWDDPAIAADNPGAALPALAITPVNRSDESGTTENFTEYLAAAAPGAWPFEPDGEWPVEGGESAQGNSGVIDRSGSEAPGLSAAIAGSFHLVIRPSKTRASVAGDRPRSGKPGTLCTTAIGEM